MAKGNPYAKGGGNWGNKGREGGNPNLTYGIKKGALSTELRRKCRSGWAEAIPGIIAIAKGEVGNDGLAPKHADQINAWQSLGKYGMGEIGNVSVSPEGRDIAVIAINIVAEIYGPEKLHQFIEMFLDAAGSVDYIDGVAELFEPEG